MATLKHLPAVLAALVLLGASGPAVADCDDCGTVSSIQEQKEKGDASGAGAVIGAVVGGMAGRQVGSGRGQDAATATGAVAGGVAGHQVERRMNSEVFYAVTVKMDEGGSRTVNVDELNGLTVGSKVKVSGGNLEMASR